jgi:3-deoxy-7-phosphoheptulonate synthase
VQALAAADGLIVEVHPDPENALSDGEQSLTPTAFQNAMADCRKVAQLFGKAM